jgi:hypothetical protein
MTKLEESLYSYAGCEAGCGFLCPGYCTKWDCIVTGVSMRGVREWLRASGVSSYSFKLEGISFTPDPYFGKTTPVCRGTLGNACHALRCHVNGKVNETLQSAQAAQPYEQMEMELNMTVTIAYLWGGKLALWCDTLELWDEPQSLISWGHCSTAPPT